MNKRMILPALALCLSAVLAVPAGALEYTIETDKAPNYGNPTSIETVITPGGGKMKNEDLSKNASIIPPGFGTPTSNTLNTGVYLTPNLVASQMAQGGISGSASAVVTPPDVIGATGPSQDVQSGTSGSAGNVTTPPDAGGTPAASQNQTGSSNISQSFIQGGVTYTTAFTEVTDDLYYSGGYLAILKIPSLNVNVKVYEGTSNSVLAKGAGHFEDTSIWDGNCAIAGHNRGTTCYFGDIHKLNVGDKITLTTKLGTRTYAVASVSKISETDQSGLAATSQNQITLYTCVRDQSAYRWCVVATEIAE